MLACSSPRQPNRRIINNMNKITKLLIAITLGLSLGYGIQAARSFPSINGITTDASTGKSVSHPGFDIKQFSRFASVTEASICSGKCLIYDVLLTSGVAASYAILYDSAPATAGTTVIVSALHFNGTTPVSLAAGNPNAFPIATTRGLGIDLTSVSAGEEVLVLYKDLD